MAIWKDRGQPPISGKTYVLVADYLDNAVQIMELSPTLKTSQSPPVLEQIQNHTIPELSKFRLDINATDSDTPASNLMYSATGLPTGSSLDTTTGVFTWTPTKAQNGIHDITVTVSDGMRSDSQVFTVTVYTTDPINDKFSSNLEGWSYYEKPNLDEIQQYCGSVQNTDVYSLSQSQEHGGSVLVSEKGVCWFGNVGAIKVFTIPSNYSNVEMLLSLDYRSLAATGDSNVNNIIYVVYDSSDNIIQSAGMFPAQRNSGILDTGWRSYDTTVSPMSASQCPCKLVIFTDDGWIADWRKSIYFDNVVFTLFRNQSSPVLDTISNHTIPELSKFRLDINATDSDTPASNLMYSATGLPTGSSLDTTTGVFTWTPTKAQNGIHDITVTVSDGAATDSQTFTITVVQNGSTSPPP